MFPGTHAATDLTDSSGRFEMRAFANKDGVVPGKYEISVTRSVEIVRSLENFDPGEDAAHAEESPEASVTWKNDLPQSYAVPATSGLTLTVSDEGVDGFEIKLTSQPQ